MSAVKIARIKEVSLNVGLTPSAQACFEMKKFLDDKAVPYKLLAYMDAAQHADVLTSLGTWGWGFKRETREFTDFPVLTWVVFDDDFNSYTMCATSIDEVTKQLLPHLALIKL